MIEAKKSAVAMLVYMHVAKHLMPFTEVEIQSVIDSAMNSEGIDILLDDIEGCVNEVYGEQLRKADIKLPDLSIHDIRRMHPSYNYPELEEGIVIITNIAPISKVNISYAESLKEYLFPEYSQVALQRRQWAITCQDSFIEFEYCDENGDSEPTSETHWLPISLFINHTTVL